METSYLSDFVGFYPFLTLGLSLLSMLYSHAYWMGTRSLEGGSQWISTYWLIRTAGGKVALKVLVSSAITKEVSTWDKERKSVLPLPTPIFGRIWIPQKWVQ